MDAIYNGKPVDFDNFRVVMHHKDNIKCVAEGWENYQNLLHSGKWFEKKEDIPKDVAIKPKTNKKRR